MATRSYTDDERAEALALYNEVGPSEAARRLKIPSKTISSWASREGLQSDDASRKRTENARAAALAAREVKREDLRSLMLDKALDMLQRMDAPHKDFKSTKEGIHTVEWDRATSGACKDYATAAAILVDKFRLEVGEATSRTEEVTKDEVDAFLAGAHAEWQRQQEQAKS